MGQKCKNKLGGNNRKMKIDLFFIWLLRYYTKNCEIQRKHIKTKNIRTLRGMEDDNNFIEIIKTNTLELAEKWKVTIILPKHKKEI